MDKYIIRRDEIAGMDGEQKTHFLNPNAVRINKSLGDLCGIRGFGFHIIEIAPGKASTEYHVHQFEDECVYILQGEAEVEIGEDIVTVSQGDFIGYKAGGLAHTMTNTGTETLKCIVVGERLAHDVADYPKLNKRLYRNHGQGWDLVDIADVDTLKK
ncbi:cupin domain-containing protein [Aliagarivorans marinus]|uniref:cupin domain-containing protein n=1 Tax=Aliagarivorans marinus TaxID=561965 RepID=UPI00041203DD|nr:cupin domain-containing protein [Aliagarivorans marinus]